MSSRPHPALRIALIAVCLLLARSAWSEAPARLSEGDAFPDFTLRHSDGSPWHLADHAGTPKLVMFWATWCPYCRRLMPRIVELHGEYAPRGLEVVAVSFRDDGDTDAYARRMGMDFDVLVQGDDLAKRLGVRGTPTVFVVDRDGRVVMRTSDSDPHNEALTAAVAAVTAPPSTGH